MIKTLLFHKEVYFPHGTQESVKDLQIHLYDYQLSRHLQEHLDNVEDKSHDYLMEQVKTALEVIRNFPQEPFEVELQGRDGYWMITKYCVRVHTTGKQDLILVIRPGTDIRDFSIDYNRNLVVTAWLNASTDSHSTLDVSKYCSKEEWNNLRFDKK